MSASTSTSTSASRTAIAVSQDLMKLLEYDDQRDELEAIILELEGYSIEADAGTRARLPDDRLTYIRKLRNEIRKRNNS